MARTTIDQLIVNSPHEEPAEHWRYDRVTRSFDRAEGRRPAGYVVASQDSRAFDDPGVFVEIPLVNQIRPRVKAWREAGYPGVTSMTKRLLTHWTDPEEFDSRRFFFCQVEAAETLIWLTEAPAAEKVGVQIPSDGGAFRRLCAKMATEFRTQRIVFEAARNEYDLVQPNWTGGKALLLAQLVRLIEQFIRSDSIRIAPALFRHDDLKRRLIITLNMTKVVQHVWEGIRFENTERLEPVFDRDRPIRSTGDMATWYTGKPCERAARSHINFCVYDGTWEATEAFALDRADEVAAWVKNDHLGFEVSYVHRGVVRKYRPDFLIRLTSGDMLVLEVKGQDSDRDQTKRQFLDEWVRAVNAHGGFGCWSWDVSKNPGEVQDILAKHASSADKVVGMEAPRFGATRRTGFLAGEISVPKDFDRTESSEIETMFETDE